MLLSRFWMIGLVSMIAGAAEASLPYPVSDWRCFPPTREWRWCETELPGLGAGQGTHALIEDRGGNVKLLASGKEIWSTVGRFDRTIVAVPDGTTRLAVQFNRKEMPRLFLGSRELLELVRTKRTVDAVKPIIPDLLPITGGIAVAVLLWLLTKHDPQENAVPWFLVANAGFGLIALQTLNYSAGIGFSPDIRFAIRHVATICYSIGLLRCILHVNGLSSGWLWIGFELVVIAMGDLWSPTVGVFGIAAGGVYCWIIGKRSGTGPKGKTNYLFFSGFAFPLLQSCMEFFQLPSTFYRVQLPLGVGMTFRNFGWLLIIVAMTGLITKRFAARNRERVEREVEIQGAAEMQAMLLSGAAVSSKAFTISSRYVPARQIAGDFHVQLQLDEGSVLVVVGDAQGKGFRPALLVSQLVGILRANPATPEVSANTLNEFLCTSAPGELVTAAFALIHRDGTVQYVSAGHLAPYLENEEFAVNPQPPLGLSRSTRYLASEFVLQPGQRLTLISDGIVEARNVKGELFGFDRTVERIGCGIESLIQAAQAWGQEDDMTALEVRLR